MTSCITIFLVLAFPYLLLAEPYYNCNTTYSCSNETINSALTILSTAYHSSSGEQTILKTTGSKYISCSGDRSCENTQLLNGNQYVYCTGDSSCYRATNISSRQFQCVGSNSCSNTYISTGRNGPWLYCGGDQSCAYSTFYGGGVDEMLGFGAFSLINSEIDTDTIDSDTVTIYLNGYYSGYNLTIKCRSSDTCYIHCKGTGCINTEVRCFGACNLHINCSESTYNYCPNTNYSGLSIGNIDMLYDIYDLSNEYTTLCDSNNNNNGYTFDDRQEARGEIITANASNENICCRGWKSCKDSEITIVSENMDMVCSASRACVAATINLSLQNDGGGSAIANSGNNIYCDGYLGCEHGIIDGGSNDFGNLVHCGGYASCNTAKISNVYRVVCSATWSCRNATIMNVNEIYVLGWWEVATLSTIDSNYMNSNMTVYLNSHNAGKSMTIYCRNGDYCNIKCNTFGACNSDNMNVYCYNDNCNIDCNEDDSISCPNIVDLAPTITTTEAITPSSGSVISTTIAAAAATTTTTTSGTTSVTEASKEATKWESTMASGSKNETDGNLEASDGNTDEEIESVKSDYISTLLAFVAVFLVLIFASYIDAWCFRQNELFQGIRLILLAMYTLDFVSDCFFVAQMILTYVDPNDIIHLSLLASSIIFVVVPLFANVFQLQKEIKRWMSDPDSKQVIRPWMRYNMRVLYLLSFISGSAFSAVELCNSYCFQMTLFSMGLSQRDIAAFKNQRIFTIVLLENVPQFIIQLIYLLVVSSGGSNLVTVFAMVFTVLSVLSSILEYWSQSYLLGIETIIIVKFNVFSDDIRDMSRNKFHQKIEMKRIGIESEISKLLTVDFDIIEELKPIQTKQGALITIHIATDDMKAAHVWQTLQTAVVNGVLPEAVKNIFKLESMPGIEIFETKELVASWEQQGGRKSIANFVVQSHANSSNTAETYPMTTSMNTMTMNVPGLNTVQSNSIEYVQQVAMTPMGTNENNAIPMPQSPGAASGTIAAIAKTETMQDDYGQEGQGTAGASIYQ